jgi:peptidoglycan/LPS O-acetylase OafA/YrhL
MAAIPGRSLPRLTSLRWYAALLVFVYHACPYVHWQPLWALNGFGPTGVTFFFVLSGFVLAWSTPPATPARVFYRRRFARIYPACLVSLLVTALVLELWPSIGLPTGAVAFLGCVLLLQAWAPGTLAGFDGPQWSLSAEAFFYACFPWLNRRLRNLTPAVRERGALLGLASAMVVSQVAEKYGHGGIAYSDPVVRMAEFVFGIVLALRVQAGWRPRIPVIAAVALVGAAFAVCHIAAVQLDFPLEDYVVVLPAGALIVAAAVADLGKRPGVLTQRWAVYLGELSFCFYLVHYPVIAALETGLSWDGPAALAAVFAVTFVLSVALHELVELPCQRLFRGGPGSIGPNSALGVNAGTSNEAPVGH